MTWKQRFGVGAFEVPPPNRPRFQDVVVPGELKCTVHLHDLDLIGGGVPCWSYVTDGLSRHGQREVIFTLVREPEERPERYPRDPLDNVAHQAVSPWSPVLATNWFH
jgi:hypothetical protein